MELQIHLHQGFLHMLDMSGGIFDQPFALAQVGAQNRDLGLGSETAAQKAVGMKLTQP